MELNLWTPCLNLNLENKYCKKNVLDKDSPSIKFKSKPCNPCDSDCNFTCYII